MKRILSMLLVLSLLLGCSAVFADGMGVQVIVDPNAETEPVSLDDFKLNSEVSIEGYGKLTGTYFGFIDKLGHYPKGSNYIQYSDGHNKTYESGADAEYAILKIDIINLSTHSINFLDQCEVKAIYDDLYEYAGWCYQYNHNNQTYGKNRNNTEDVIDKADIFAIDPMYAGHYCFGCTLPNAVVEGKGSLRLIITIGGNEITYNIRK